MSIEALIKMMPGSIDPASIENIRSTKGSSALAGQELATLMSGLSPAEENLIWCKYLSEVKLCQRGLQSYRAELYSNKEIMNWVWAADVTSKKKRNQTIDTRTSASVVLSSCAYNDMIGSFMCTTCKGVGHFQIANGELECEDCGGKGKTGNQSSAQDRANKLHVSLSTYWRVWHPPFEEYYWSTITRLEISASQKIADNFL